MSYEQNRNGCDKTASDENEVDQPDVSYPEASSEANLLEESLFEFVVDFAGLTTDWIMNDKRSERMLLKCFHETASLVSPSPIKEVLNVAHACHRSLLIALEVCIK